MIYFLLAGALSWHVTDTYAPAGGYNERHLSLGLETVTSDRGWNVGGLALYFPDSFGKTSHLGALTVGHTFNTGDFSFRPHLGVGHLKTSYYSGVYAAPALDTCYKKHCLKHSVTPPLSKIDAVYMVQYGFRF